MKWGRKKIPRIREMREENSPLNGEEREEEEKIFPEILWEEKYSEKFPPNSKEEMKEIEEFYEEILQWRNENSEGNMGENFLFPPEGMEGEIYREIHSLILSEGIPFIQYIQEFLHGNSILFKEKINSKEELRKDFKLFQK